MVSQNYTPSEITMLEVLITELREEVIRLERDKFLLTEQVKKLEEMVKK
jgi:hypothetical protein